jgi:hypothetical protein
MRHKQMLILLDPRRRLRHTNNTHKRQRMRLIPKLHDGHRVPIDGIAGVYIGGVAAKVVSRVDSREISTRK